MDKGNRKIVLIIHNVRSAHNAGSLLRSADGLGVNRVIFSGYTPHPQLKNEYRLPHIAQKVDLQIQKTALGADKHISWAHTKTISSKLAKLKAEGFELVALEQSPSAIPLNKYRTPQKIVIVVGNEVEGVDPSLLREIPTHLEIPMLGSKESFNVSVAGAIAMYHLRYS